MSITKLNKEFTKLNHENRLYNINIPIIGLTGSIATGKTTVANIIKSLKHKVVDADALIKEIYAQSDTLEFIKEQSADFIDGERVNFPRLRESFFQDKQLKEKVTNYLYLKLPDIMRSKISNDDQYIFYDVPLLFENQLENYLDITIAVYCTESQQLERLLKRDRISSDLALKMISSQISIEEKKSKADFTIENTKDNKHLRDEVLQLLAVLF